MDNLQNWEPAGFPEIDVAFATVDNALTSIRLAAFRNGFRPLPVAGIHMRVKHPGKQPVMDAWREKCARADETFIRSWSDIEPDCVNTGLMTGISGGVVAADIDVLIPEVVAEIADLASELLGVTPLERVGKAPKVLFVYRASDVFRKVKTPEFLMPDGSKGQVGVTTRTVRSCTTQKNQ
jgi:putative DNA primase/helicase